MNYSTLTITDVWLNLMFLNGQEQYRRLTLDLMLNIPKCLLTNATEHIGQNMFEAERARQREFLPVLPHTTLSADHVQLCNTTPLLSCYYTVAISWLRAYCMHPTDHTEGSSPRQMERLHPKWHPL